MRRAQQAYSHGLSSQKSCPCTVSVQTADFDLAAEVDALRGHNQAIGAVTSFVGLMRDFNLGDEVSAMFLEHYPGMTERSLLSIAEQAGERWQLEGVRIVHRIGSMRASDQIVLVAVASAHRGEAFSACEFIMDYLKTEAPFWKKEVTAEGERWLDARACDDAARARW